MSGSVFLSVLVMAKFHFSLSEFFASLSHITSHKGTTTITSDFMNPGMKFKNPLDFISLSLALVFGTAGLPHILIRFYTVPDAKTARSSGGLGHGVDRRFLYHDDVLRLRRGQPARSLISSAKTAAATWPLPCSPRMSAAMSSSPSSAPWRSPPSSPSSPA